MQNVSILKLMVQISVVKQRVNFVTQRFAGSNFLKGAVVVLLWYSVTKLQQKRRKY